MNKIITYISFFTILLTSLKGTTQQQLVFTNFMMNSYYYNPAIAGSDNVHHLDMSYRNQWSGFEGAPTAIIGSFYGSYKNQGKMGYGVSLINERVGLMQNTGVYLNYAHHFKLSDDIKLGLGVRPGFVQYRIKLYDAVLADEGDEILTGNILSNNALDFDGGFHLYSDQFFVMGSIQSLLGKAIQFTSYNESLSKQFTFIAGYNYEFKSKPISLQPSLLWKYSNPVPNQYSVMLKATFQKKYWAGILYRSGDAIGITLGADLMERLSLGYAYDFSVNSFSQYNSGSHEIVIKFIPTSKKVSLEEEDEKLNNSIMEEMKQKIKNKK